MATRGQELKKMSRVLLEQVNEVAREATVRVMNDLAEKGPEWSGDFKNSWMAIPAGKGASGSTGGEYPYTIDDVPKLSTNLAEMRRVTKFRIENRQPYAPYALDLEEGVFRGDKKGNFPIGKVVATGSRPSPGKRGNVTGGEGEATSTAEKDWYRTYLKGGAMKKAIVEGVRAGFKK
jgi:hypothetical protein